MARMDDISLVERVDDAGNDGAHVLIHIGARNELYFGLVLAYTEILWHNILIQQQFTSSINKNFNIFRRRNGGWC